VSDAESDISSSSGCDPTTITADTAGTTLTCTATSAGGTSSQSVTIKRDATPPALNVAAGASGTYELCAGIPNRPNFAPSDALSGLDGSQGDSWSIPGTATGVGTYTYNAHAQDQAGNPSSETLTYVVQYGSAFGGFRPPITVDGRSRFHLGSTIPIMFQLTCNGAPIGPAVATLTVHHGDSTPDPGVDETISTSAATTGNQFRYDPTGQQYIFNLSTKQGYLTPGATTATPFTPGTWTLGINLDDGTSHIVVIQLVG
jgi:hypothetical protein